jgi:hypothetical protein
MSSASAALARAAQLLPLRLLRVDFTVVAPQPGQPPTRLALDSPERI